MHYLSALFLISALLLAACGGGAKNSTPEAKASAAAAAASDAAGKGATTDIITTGQASGAAIFVADTPQGKERVEKIAGRAIRDNEVLVAITWGEKPTGGYSVTVKSVKVDGDTVRIYAAFRAPAAGTVTTQALNTPTAWTSIEKATLPVDVKKVALHTEAGDILASLPLPPR